MRGESAAECDSKHLMDRRSEVSEAAGWTAALGASLLFLLSVQSAVLGFF